MTGYFEDFTVGGRYATRTRTITDADHEAFCHLTGYTVPLFLDNDYARQRGLAGLGVDGAIRLRRLQHRYS